ncbi:MAG: hypothetical protein WA126_13335 [Thermodesulfovibrionales bacterium]
MIKDAVIFLSGGVTGGVIVYFFKALYEHYLALSRSIEVLRITESNKAAADIRGAFAPTLAILYLAKKHRNYSGDTVPPFDVDRSLKEALLTQASAIEIFRPHVSEDKRTAYQEAWEKYRYEVFNYGFDTTTFRTDVDDAWKVYEDHIHKILQFAEIKDK